MGQVSDDVVEHLSGGPTLVIAFATEKHVSTEGLPHHEFGNTLRRLGLAHVLVRDRGHWYHQGVPGIGGIEETTDWLRSYRGQYDRLVMIGVSYGAHGALMYGQLVPADEVIAISPIADVGAWDRYWAAKKGKKHRRHLAYTLEWAFARGPVPKVRAFIGTGRNTELDRPSCDKLKLTDVTVFAGAGHAGLAKHMRDSGMFAQLLTEKADALV